MYTVDVNTAKTNPVNTINNAGGMSIANFSSKNAVQRFATTTAIVTRILVEMITFAITVCVYHPAKLTASIWSIVESMKIAGMESARIFVLYTKTVSTLPWFVVKTKDVLKNHSVMKTMKVNRAQSKV